MNLELFEAIEKVNAGTVTYAQAAEMLNVHEAYARRIVEESAQEADVVRVQGRPLLLRSFVEQLVETRANANDVREAERAEALAAKEQARAEREAKRAEKAAAEELKAAERAAKAAEREAAKAAKAAAEAEAEAAKANAEPVEVKQPKKGKGKKATPAPVAEGEAADEDGSEEEDVIE